MISYDQLGRPEDSIIVFQLNGVQDLVYAVVKNHTGCSREPFYETIYFLKKSNSVDYNIIDPRLMDVNAQFAGSPLDFEWGWHRPAKCRGMFPNHKGWYYNTCRTRSFETIKKEILQEFEKIKKVYDRNTNVLYR